ncbi:hypothetical protein ES703_20685 [subsurface metagenome]
MPRFGEAHKLLSPTHPDTEAPAAGADPSDGQVATWSDALKAWIAADPAGDGISDHGLLDGLADDDHPHYALADKSRPDPWVAAADLAARSIADLGTKDHDLLDGLTDDDHSIYALLAGRSGGQTFVGGRGSGEHVTLQSTAHATRGYVRAQDDLQLLSNILRDSGGNNRLELATASPHLTLTGDAKLKGNIAVAGGNVSATKAITIAPTPSPSGTSYIALGGQAALTYPSGGSGGSLWGLNFMAMVGGGGGGAAMYFVGGAYARCGAMNFTGSIAGMYGLQVPVPFIMGGAPSIATWRALAVDPCGMFQIVDAYGLQVGDITGNSGFRRLLEVGPSTPYLRVVGGAAPAAGLSNLYLNVGGTLYQVRTRTINGYDCLSIN